MKKIFGLGLVGVLALTGCAASAPSMSRHSQFAAQLEVTSGIDSGDTITSAYKDAGLFESIADDLDKYCTQGKPDVTLYASQLDEPIKSNVVTTYKLICKP